MKTESSITANCIIFYNWYKKFTIGRQKDAKLVAAAAALNKTFNKRSKKYVGTQSAIKFFKKQNQFN